MEFGVANINTSTRFCQLYFNKRYVLLHNYSGIFFTWNMSYSYPYFRCFIPMPILFPL